MASILINYIVEEDRITVRPSYIKLGQIAAGTAVSTLIPFYGSPIAKLVAASGGHLYDLSGVNVIASGYGGDDWAWTSFSNLSAIDYTIMVNGHDGVVSWDGVTFLKEAVTPPTGEAWINPNKFDKVLSHMNLLWFADSDNLSVYYPSRSSKRAAR